MPSEREPTRGKLRELPLPPGVQVLERRQDVTVAVDGSVMVQIWHATATLESMTHCEAALERFVAEQPRFVTLTVVGNNVSAPNAAVREVAGRIAARFEARAVANAVVFEGNEFKRTAIRLALATIHLLSPPVNSGPVFGRVEEASRWLAERLPEVSPLQLVRVVAALRGAD